MKIKKIILILILLFFCVSLNFAKTKTIIKEDTEIVPANKTQEEVEEHLKQRLTIIALEEAGMFVSTRLQIENNKIIKDIYSNNAGAITEREVIQKKIESKDDKLFIYIKLKIKIDMDSVENYLDKVAKDAELEDTIDELRDELKKTKDEIKSKNLSKELAILVEEEQINYDKMTLNAKEDFEKFKQKQIEEDLIRQKELNDLEKQNELHKLQTQQKIEQEKDNIKKRELENEQRIKELEDNAKQNLVSLKKKETLSLQKIIKETNELKSKVNKIVTDYDKALIKNKTNLKNSYDKQIELTKENKFLEKKPIKDKYEESVEFNNRLKEYKKRKEDFLEQNKEQIQKLKYKEKLAIINDETETLKSMVKTIQPFIEQIEEYQKQNLYDKNTYIKPDSISDIDVDNKNFYIFFRYQKTKYKYKINYLEKNEGIEIYETYKQFIIQPYFTIKEDKKGIYIPFLLGFKITHLGTNKKYYYKLANTSQTEDINFYKPILKDIHYHNQNQIKKIIMNEKIELIRTQKEKLKKELNSLRNKNSDETITSLYQNKKEQQKLISEKAKKEKAPEKERKEINKNIEKQEKKDFKEIFLKDYISLYVGLVFPISNILDKCTISPYYNKENNQEFNITKTVAGLDVGISYFHFLYKYLAVGINLSGGFAVSLGGENTMKESQIYYSYEANQRIFYSNISLITKLYISDFYLTKERWYIPIEIGYCNICSTITPKSPYDNCYDPVSFYYSGISYATGIGFEYKKYGIGADLKIQKTNLNDKVGNVNITDFDFISLNFNFLL